MERGPSPQDAADVRTQIQVVWGFKFVSLPRCAELLIHGLLRGHAVDPTFYLLWQLLELCRRTAHQLTADGLCLGALMLASSSMPGTPLPMACRC
eukprot:4684144-Amphidinium_carterae.1